MGSSSSSNKTTNIQETTSFNNMGEASGGFAGNINLNHSDLKIGDVTQTDHGAIAAGGAVAEKALDANMALGDRAFDSVDSTQEMTQKMFGTATGAITDATRGTLQQMAGQTDRALAFATNATRSEGAALTEKMVTWGIGGAAALTLAVMMINRS